MEKPLIGQQRLLVTDAHRHEWVFDTMPMEIRCLTCHDERMSLEEGERRLNAVECLSAEDAAHIAECIAIDSSIAFLYADDLDDYAKALEGKDD